MIFGSLFLLYTAGFAFYITFKKYEEDDSFDDQALGVDLGLTIVQLIIDVLLLISKKLAPKKYYIVIFKTFSFLFGLFFLCCIIFLWIILLFLI